eukprot:CAMPEP_0195284942 /NCGR_PEP_ID=MMETSP0707-20130614/2954_1 /TAXON_ID=33640 /ORGANISM="Asterionellopsis glacialis, Strain CCMP134" /LENGTH=327 /DNA_ID=CAMNT_0040344351 /DNA_START=76 /DNA_END=1059 /DNA_ORIENTATION=-
MTRPQKKKLPWYRSGGMHVNMVGMGINIATPILMLVTQLPDERHMKSYAGLTALCIVASWMTCKSMYCIAVVPANMVSLLLAAYLKTPLVYLWGMALVVAMTKVNICMSVCLHRYAAHAAFKCGPCTNFAVNILGCLANQGGPIWWASQHRCHHKYCDVPRDPHSALLDGTEAAFGFFEHHQEVLEEFAPKHIESTWIRWMDTWSWIFVSLEFVGAFALFGYEGLFVAQTSAWICQSITLWFNIANHPPEKDTKCKASDGKAALHEMYLPFHFLDALVPLFSLFIMEGEHQHHHDHAGLAKRSTYDSAYWGFVKPLEMMGLVWKVNV